VVTTLRLILDAYCVQNKYEPGRPRPRIILLEHDKRFDVFPEFEFYDFMYPFKLPGASSPRSCGG
jgi:NADH dehydrogenase (ubiquinone) 1 alpha subcomplex subunit 9